MTALSADDVRALARDALPSLVFSDNEKFFPVRAESWLTHTTTAPWDDADPDDLGALSPDRHRRGTAIMRAGLWVEDPVHVGGPPNPEDRPVRLERTGTPDAIGNPDYAADPPTGGEYFLSFAGWDDPHAPHEGGDLDYLQEAFSELASAINHDVPWEPIAKRSNRPFFGHPQPVSPAVYCEVDWAGAHFREAPPASGIEQTDLDGFIQVTYYLLFAARVALADQPNVKPLEGQWAALSLFYPARAETHELDEHHRPVEVEMVSSSPTWVVLSQDSEGNSNTLLRFGQGETEVLSPGDHVKVWVGAGTHRLFASPNAEVPLNPGEPWPVLEYEPGGDLEGLFPLLGPSLMGDAVGGEGLGTFVGLTGLSGPAGGWVWFLLNLLWNLLSELWDDDASKGDIPPSADSPVQPGGAVGDPAHGEAAPPEQGGAGSADFPTNEGSLEGWDVAYFDMKVISRIASATEPDLEPPAWWDYAGRWGIMVPPEAQWASGMRRTDHLGRSWAYWHATSLFNRLVQDAGAPDAP